MLKQTRYHLEAAERALLILKERSLKAKDTNLSDKLISFANLHGIVIHLCTICLLS